MSEFDVSLGILVLNICDVSVSACNNLVKVLLGYGGAVSKDILNSLSVSE
jgi:hypothetical protein